MQSKRRRQLLGILGVTGLGAFAGCSVFQSSNPNTTTEQPPTFGTETAAPTETPTQTTSDTTQTLTASPTATLTPTATGTSPLTTQTTKVGANDGDQDDHFGKSVGVSDDGTTAIIGAPLDEDPNGTEAGSAYVFTRTGGTWSQQAKLVPDDGDDTDLFGWSVAVSDDGTTAVVGTYYDEDPNGDRAGSAYVFTRAGGAWSQQAKLFADDGDPGDVFGSSVAMSGNGTTAIAGAYIDGDPNGDRAGSAYVFTRAGDAWNQQAKLFADDGDDTDVFGSSVAVTDDGTTAIIGAPQDENSNTSYAGSVYVFETAGGAWSQQAKFSPDDGDTDDQFGSSVEVSGDGTTAIVGAFEDEDPNGIQAGSAYVFTRSGDSWSQQAKLVPDDGDDKDRFGWAAGVTDDGTTAIITTRWDEDPHGEATGAAYVFKRSSGSWSQQVKLTPDDDGDFFGSSVGVAGDGTTAIIGARWDEDPNGNRAGSAYVFE